MVFDKDRPIIKGLSILIIGSLILEIVKPNISYAQTGPNQTESLGYNHTAAADNVNTFTGDFTYSIPLMEIDGLPLILSYNADVSMNQEASWVGFGWSLNPGSINRDMRGLPDEFNGEDEITREFKTKNPYTLGKKSGAELSAGFDPSLTGLYAGINPSISFFWGKYSNTYRGLGKTTEFNIGLALGWNAPFNIPVGGSNYGSLGFSFDTQNGIGFNPSWGGTYRDIESGKTLSSNYSTSMSTRDGKSNRVASYSRSTPGIDFNSTGTGASRVVKTFVNQSYVPRFDFDQFGWGYSSRKGGGLYVNVLGVSASINGAKESYNILNYRTSNTINSPAYGYHNLEKAIDDEEGVMDFNREKERLFSENMETLPFTNVTYDLYTINTPGISSMFRAYRNDVGTFSDPTRVQKSENDAYSKSQSFGLVYKKVESNTEGVEESTSGKWETPSGVNDYLNFLSDSDWEQIQGAEKFYFKSVGELTPFNESIYNAYGGIAPGKLGIEQIALDDPFLKTNNTLHLNGASAITVPSNNYTTGRSIRSTNIVYLYNNELAALGTDEIRDYDFYSTSTSQPSYTVINDSYRLDHHIGKIEVTQASGLTYGYGIPAYNIEKSDVSFNVEPGESDPNLSSGLVNYEIGSFADNSLSNQKGRDEFYDKTTIPAYAHSYLLTDIKSSDYADRTGNGLSPDDAGSYIKVNYSRAYGGSQPFKWRFPVSEKATSTNGYPQADYSEGYQTDPLDDKGFYSYGEKEVWYPHSIETKNYILEFHLEDRKDGYPVVGEDGELDLTKPSKLLKKIVLYAREDRMNNGLDATPLKEVIFEYSYSLCKNYPSNKHTKLADNYNESGKLTLESVHINKGNTKQGYQSPYVFEYGTGSNNPDFEYADVDRWMNYKENSSTQDNHYFPYSDQNETTANDDILAWKLKRMVYPTGGGVEIEYEADSYTHIQDKGVMRHYDIIGMSDFVNLIELNNVSVPTDNYESSGLGPSQNITGEFRYAGEKKTPNQVVYFALDEPISGNKADVDAQIKADYFGVPMNGQTWYLNELYYRTKVKVQFADEEAEFISGFAKIKHQVNKFDQEYKKHKSDVDNATSSQFTSIQGVGAVGGSSGTFHYGYVILQTHGVKDKIKNGEFVKKGYPVHPMQKNAWNFVRLNMPWHIYANCEDSNGDPSIDDCEYSYSMDWKTIFTGKINKVLNNNDYCRTFDNSLSTMRLMDSRRFKYGGNGRVKSITYFDSWDEMSGETEASYTLEYDYTDSETGLTSGVASYEPKLGGDENIFFQPAYFLIDNALKPDERHYQIDPVGESMYPSPVVGYSEVSVKFKDIQDLTRNTTGSTKYRFYTAKDYPTKVLRTNLGISDLPFSPDNDVQYKIFGATQGFSVVLNNFHGQLRDIKVVDRFGHEVSKTEYIYHDLEDKLKVVDKDGGIDEYWLGKEFDIYVDKRSNIQAVNNLTTTTTEIINLGWPDFDESTHSVERYIAFYASTVQKVLNHTAIVKEVKTTYLGQKYNEKVLAYDKYSGSPIVSSTKNGFAQNDYQLIYKAFWRYLELGSKFQNTRFSATTNINSSSQITSFSNAENWFCKGDVLWVSDGGTYDEIALVLDVSGTTVELINPTGGNLPSGTGLNVINLQSGYKNRLFEQMATFFTKVDPIGTNTDLTISSSDIIQATATEYEENVDVICEDEEDCSGNENPNENCADDLSNPFSSGIIGNWRATIQYLFQGDRINNDATASTDIRTDGRIASFIPFYAYANGQWNTIVESDHPDYNSSTDYQNWRAIGRITEFDRFGKGIETISQEGISNSVIFGYNSNTRTLPIATAFNAKVSEVAFDGFEDYFYLSGDINCRTTGHFDFVESVSQGDVVSSERHTGNFSLAVDPSEEFSTTRSIRVCDTQTGKDCDCETGFSPGPGKYIIGLWVKEANSQSLTTYSNAKAKVEIIDDQAAVVSTATFAADGNIIEGWQRVEGQFTIPTSLSGEEYCIKVTLLNDGAEVAYFDDLRIHPFKASMTTTVYDSELLLPVAELNDYNFATIYMYDINLNQIRVRQETERGIYTIIESNSGVKK